MEYGIWRRLIGTKVRGKQVGGFGFYYEDDGTLYLEDIMLWECRRMGVATSLVSHVILSCVDYHINITVRASGKNCRRDAGFNHKKLLSWYRKLGFKFHGDFGLIKLETIEDSMLFNIRQEINRMISEESQSPETSNI
jgi:hypothetical protein